MLPVKSLDQLLTTHLSKFSLLTNTFDQRMIDQSRRMNEQEVLFEIHDIWYYQVFTLQNII